MREKSPNTEFFLVRIFLYPNTGKYGPEKAPHLDTFHGVLAMLQRLALHSYFKQLPQHYESKLPDFMKINEVQPQLKNFGSASALSSHPVGFLMSLAI